MNRSLIEKAARWLAMGVVATTLAACGGSNTCSDSYGGNACGDPGAPPPIVVGKLSLTLSAPSINNSGSQT
ncbi:MAG: hypothetical protein OEW22_00720, partial [Rubrivivax sp.]|nr:hypothetical protein [Rubrivivax sp.]